MKYWILGGVLVLIAGLYFGVGWVQTLGVGMIAFPLLIIGMVLFFILLVILAVLIFGSATLLKVKQVKEKRKK
jgi:uncharacterized membrane protein